MSGGIQAEESLSKERSPNFYSFPMSTLSRDKLDNLYLKRSED